MRLIIFQTKISGEAADFGKHLFYLITEKLKKCPKEPEKSRIAMIGTGELTITLRGKGIGGRNQEMLLNFLNTIKNEKIDYKFFVLGCNLDGIEGNSKAMGAIVDNSLLMETAKNNVSIENYLSSNNSNAFFNLINGEDHGILGDFKLDFSKAVVRKNRVVKELTDGIATLEKAWKNDVYMGHGKILNGNANKGFEISIEGDDNRKLKAKRVIIATGSTPVLIP
ncbi:unnamed protein product, partial [marine sediment metagenome]